MNVEKEFTKTLTLISKLEPVEFIGLMRLFNIKLMRDDDKTPKDFNELLNEFTEIWLKMNRKQRRNLVLFLKKIKKEAKKNGAKEV